jgi:hypothetical protein
MYIYIFGISILIFFILMINKKTYKKTCIKSNSKNNENFNVPSISSAEDISEGASEIYGWGYTPIKSRHKKHKKEKDKDCPKEEKKCRKYTIHDDICKYSDITKNVDIDKYVLKSSVPPCPDLTNYVKKDKIPPIPFNKNEWIRKSDIPPCPKINKNEWIRKDEVEPLIKKSKCPTCPVAPLVPSCKKELSDNVWKPKLSEMNEAFITEPMIGSFRF